MVQTNSLSKLFVNSPSISSAATLQVFISGKSHEAFRPESALLINCSYQEGNSQTLFILFYHLEPPLHDIFCSPSLLMWDSSNCEFPILCAWVCAAKALSALQPSLYLSWSASSFSAVSWFILMSLL